jgi:hypothetical protein
MNQTMIACLDIDVVCVPALFDDVLKDFVSILLYPLERIS